MIPSDLAARLRLLTEGSVQPVSPAAEIPGALPEFHPGSRIVARIEAVLPDGTFRALVAGRSVTLALPQSANPGDSLELVVTERTPKVVFAARADSAASAATLSRAGQLIGMLLSAREGAAQRQAVSRLLPLLPQPTPQAAPLAAALKQAFSESGLFYESHQAQWVAGRFPLDDLLKEPQGKHSRVPVAPPPAAEAVQSRATDAEAAPAGGGETQAAMPAREAARPTPSALPLPPDLLPIVQQQLDAVATHQVLWQGELWPGQTLHWEIEEGDHEPGPADAGLPRQWITRIKLTFPNMGEIAADMVLTSAGVRIDLAAPEAALDGLRMHQGELVEALRGAGITPIGISVQHHGARA
ncbi:MAG: flagellar hook-length control protein FliK [Pseudomonadota bacterium]